MGNRPVLTTVDPQIDHSEDPGSAHLEEFGARKQVSTGSRTEKPDREIHRDCHRLNTDRTKDGEVQGGIRQTELSWPGDQPSRPQTR